MPRQSDTTVLDRLTIDFERLLQDVPELGPEHHWEGTLNGAHGAAADCNLGFRASLAFHGALVEGTGRWISATGKLSEGEAAVTLTGTQDGDAINLELWLAHPDARRVPMSCRGFISTDGREITGDWSVTCFNPDTCGCAGGGGTFKLTRVD